MSRRTIWFPGKVISREELVIESQEANLAKVRDFLVPKVVEAGFSNHEAHNLRLALDEATSNVMRHAYQGGPGKIKLVIIRHTRYMRFELVDQGRGFDWHARKTPDLNQYVAVRKKGGLGIWFIRKLTDASDYHSRADGNHLVLWKRLPGAARERTRQALAARMRVSSVREAFITRTTLVMAGIIVLSFGYGTYRVRSVVQQRYVENAKSVSQNLAAASLDRLYKREDLLLTNLAADVVRHDPGLDYALITDLRGMILGHSDLSKVFGAYVPPPGIGPAGATPQAVAWTDASGAKFYDVRVAIKDGPRLFGEVHVGLKDAAIMSAVRREQLGLLGLGLLVLGLGVVGSWFLIRIIISPINVLTEGVMAIGEGKLDHRIALPGDDEFGRIAKAFNEMTVSLSFAQKGLIEQEAMKKELQVAKVIQQTLLPRSLPEVEGYDVGSLYRAAKDVGGDYFDFIKVDRKRFGICVADVSGKGVPGSLVMTMIRTSMRAEARSNPSPSDVLGLVNNFVMDDMKRGMFVTLFYLVLDAHRREITYASAGHDPLVLFRAATRKTYLLKPRGFPLGIQLPDRDQFRRSLGEERVHLSKGDILVAYTDGIVEAMNDRREQFGMDRFLAVIREHHALPAVEFVAKANEAIAAFTGDYPQNDDITLVAIKEGLSETEMKEAMYRRLMDMIEVKKLPVTEACRRCGLTTDAWYRFKRRRAAAGLEKAMHGRPAGKEELRLVSLEERELLYPILAEKPQWGPKEYARELAQRTGGSVRLDADVVEADLVRLKLDTPERRQKWSVRRPSGPNAVSVAPALPAPRQAETEAALPEPVDVVAEPVETPPPGGDNAAGGKTGAASEEKMKGDK